MLSRLIKPIRSSLLLHCKATASKRWRCTVSSDWKNESVFVVAGGDDYRMIDKTGANASYIPPWSTSESSSVKMRKITQVSNSCNGMMLIAQDNSIFLFNPATKYLQKVLQLNPYDKEKYHSHTKILIGLFFNKKGLFIHKIGLFFDPSINDYKALVLFRNKERKQGSVGGVASLKGKQWTKVDTKFQFCNVEQGVVLNGRLHYIAEHGYYENIVVWFDPILNVFETFPSPPTPKGDYNVVLGLAVMEGCLWLTRWKNGDTHLREEIEVFKMKEYGVPESWTLMYVISHVKITLSGECMIPLLTMENGHILFSKSWAEQTNHGEILVFNPETNWCVPHSVTPSWDPDSFPFEKNLDSPVGYYWDPIEHEHFEHLDDFDLGLGF